MEPYQTNFTFFSNDPHKKLYQTGLFKLFFGVPVLIGCLLVLVVGFKGVFGLDIDPSWEGFNALFTYYKAPLWVLAAGVPLTALSAAIFRSIQTAESLKVQAIEGNASRYYAHRRDFRYHIEVLSESTSLPTKFTYLHLHRLLFNKASPESGDISLTKNGQLGELFDALSDVNALIKEIEQDISHLDQRKSTLLPKLAYKVCDLLIVLRDQLKLDKSKLNTGNLAVNSALHYVNYIFEFINSSIEFAEQQADPDCFLYLGAQEFMDALNRALGAIKASDATIEWFEACCLSMSERNED